MFALIAFAFALIAVACHNPIVWDESPNVTSWEAAEWLDVATWNVGTVRSTVLVLDVEGTQRAQLVQSIAALRTAVLKSDPLVARLSSQSGQRNRIVMRARTLNNARYAEGVA